jgi:hypothetical protein
LSSTEHRGNIHARLRSRETTFEGNGGALTLSEGGLTLEGCVFEGGASSLVSITADNDLYDLGAELVCQPEGCR